MNTLIEVSEFEDVKWITTDVIRNAIEDYLLDRMKIISPNICMEFSIDNPIGGNKAFLFVFMHTVSYDVYYADEYHVYIVVYEFEVTADAEVIDEQGEITSKSITPTHNTVYMTCLVEFIEEGYEESRKKINSFRALEDIEIEPTKVVSENIDLDFASVPEDKWGTLVDSDEEE